MACAVRSAQVECVKLLYDRMYELRRKFFNTPLQNDFSRPKFRICVLFVDENESVQRQLRRGLQARAHNEFVRLDSITFARPSGCADTC